MKNNGEIRGLPPPRAYALPLMLDGDVALKVFLYIVVWSVHDA